MTWYKIVDKSEYINPVTILVKMVIGVQNDQRSICKHTHANCVFKLIKSASYNTFSPQSRWLHTNFLVHNNI